MSAPIPSVRSRWALAAGRAGPPLLLALLLLPLAACGRGNRGDDATSGVPDREVIRDDWERHRDNVLAYVEAMPEEHFGFRPTPEVRTFAEQIEHIVVDHVDIVATAFGRDDRPVLGEQELYLRNEDALLDHVEAGYGFVLDVLDDATAAELREEAEVFGRYRVPRWKALAGALEHGTWTLGQTIPYLRLNGVEPPAYAVFPDPEEGR